MQHEEQPEAHEEQLKTSEVQKKDHLIMQNREGNKIDSTIISIEDEAPIPLVKKLPLEIDGSGHIWEMIQENNSVLQFGSAGNLMDQVGDHSSQGSSSRNVKGSTNSGEVVPDSLVYAKDSLGNHEVTSSLKSLVAEGEFLLQKGNEAQSSFQ